MSDTQLTATEENYLKAVLQISLRDQSEWVSTGRLAEHLHVSPGTVTSMLQSLAREKPIGQSVRPPLVRYKPYSGVSLTGHGRKLAMRMLRRHRLIELFLVETLSLTWDRVHEEAENLEHAVSDYLIDRIDEFLGHPTADPHGDPIPTTDGQMSTSRSESVPLSSCPPGTRFRLARVVNQRSDFLRYLTESGLELGAAGVVQQNSAEAGIVTVRVGKETVAMGSTAAKSLLVEPDGE